MYKKLLSKSDEIIDEAVEGPKEVTDFFGTKIKKGVSDFFDWNKKLTKNKLYPLNKKIIKKMFNSDNINDADFKFASFEAVQLATKEKLNAESVHSILLSLGYKRQSNKGWTKSDVTRAIQFVKLWNKRHPQNKWKLIKK